jgi:hypothetical protein
MAIRFCYQGVLTATPTSPFPPYICICQDILASITNGVLVPSGNLERIDRGIRRSEAKSECLLSLARFERELRALVRVQSVHGLSTDLVLPEEIVLPL